MLIKISQKTITLPHLPFNRIADNTLTILIQLPLKYQQFFNMILDSSKYYSSQFYILMTEGMQRAATFFTWDHIVSAMAAHI